MPKNLTMPRLSDTMEQGTIIKWHVKPGQKVKAGEVVADIETDKATMELQSFEDGVVSSTNVKEGQAVPVGTLILSWEGGTGGADVKSAPAAKSEPAQAVAAASAGGATGAGVSAASTAVATPEPAHANGHRDRVFASPLARKMAADAGVDLNHLEGTGPSGRIVRKDVEAAISGGARAALMPAASPVETKPISAPAPRQAPVTATGLSRKTWALNTMRTTIAKRLVESKTTIPHYQVTTAVRMDALMSLRQQLNDQLASQGVKLSVNDFIVRACALAMHQHPYVNTRWVAGSAPSVEFLDRVNIGVAIALPVNADGTGGGLVVATLRDADHMGLRQISAGTKALADKARSKGLSVEDMSDSTFTISNLGMYGVEHFTAIINPPNTAILAVGAAVKKPVVETRNGKDELVVGHEMQMTMSSDHRVVDGAMAAQYLATVKSLLERPATLLV